MRDIRPGTVIAVVALFIAIGGTATAASGLINGKKIKPGTVTAKQIKNKTITTGKLAPATVKSLKGVQGPTGPAGSDGAAGATGATGATGVTGAPGGFDPFWGEAYDRALPNDEPVIPITLTNVPAGTYMITAKANVISHLNISGVPNEIDCTIWTDETDGVDTALSSVYFNNSANLSMAAIAEVEDKIELRCHAWNGPGAADDLKLFATPIQ